MTDKTRKIVFALTSSGCDLYSTMTRVAVASIRLTNPDVTTCICCDTETDRACKKARDPLQDEVDQWLPQRTPPGSANFRNRFIKTKLRNTLEGSFLFLDSDILVRGDLTPLFDLDTDIAGARNHSLEEHSEQIVKRDTDSLQEMGWTVRPDVYINGGVLLYRDTEGAHRFSDEWHHRWLQCFRVRNSHRDQPALNSALEATQASLHILPDQYNAQFKRNPIAIQDAVLWHYYAANIEKKPDTQFEILIRDLMEGTSLESTRVENLIRASHPWRVQNRISERIFSLGAARGHFKGWETAFLRNDIPGYLSRNMKRSYAYARHILTQ